MSYTTTTRLGLKKAVPGSNQAFETSIFNENLDKVDAEAVAADGRLDVVEAAATSLDGRLDVVEPKVTALEALVGAGTTVRTVTGTTDTLLAGDKNNLVVYSNASAVAVTVPNVLPVGGRIDIVQDGTGQVTFTAGSGVTIFGLGTKTAARYAGATLVCVASGSYRLIGNIA